MTRTTYMMLLLSALFVGCGAAKRRLRADMKPMEATQQKAQTLQRNHFQRDKMGAVSEEAMREILDAPVFLERGARIGIVPVATGYEVDKELPLTQVTGDLARELADSGHFEIASEVTTDWPSTRSIAGLRELATRYRAEYLLLYRHRFVDRSLTNGWGWAWLTLVGGFFVPSQTLETAGVVEATLFDVKTGTLLFTVFERVNEEDDANIWHNDRKVRKIKEKLLTRAADRLAGKVLEKVGELVAARPEPEAEQERVVGAPVERQPLLTATK